MVDVIARLLDAQCSAKCSRHLFLTSSSLINNLPSFPFTIASRLWPFVTELLRIFLSCAPVVQRLSHFKPCFPTMPFSPSCLSLPTGILHIMSGNRVQCLLQLIIESILSLIFCFIGWRIPTVYLYNGCLYVFLSASGLSLPTTYHVWEPGHDDPAAHIWPSQLLSHFPLW